MGAGGDDGSRSARRRGAEQRTGDQQQWSRHGMVSVGVRGVARPGVVKERVAERRDGGCHSVKASHPRGVMTRAGIEPAARSEEHTSELQSHSDLVCRLLLENKK